MERSSSTLTRHHCWDIQRHQWSSSDCWYRQKSLRRQPMDHRVHVASIQRNRTENTDVSFIRLLDISYRKHSRHVFQSHHRKSTAGRCPPKSLEAIERSSVDRRFQATHFSQVSFHGDDIIGNGESSISKFLVGHTRITSQSSDDINDVQLIGCKALKPKRGIPLKQEESHAYWYRDVIGIQIIVHFHRQARGKELEKDPVVWHEGQREINELTSSCLMLGLDSLNRVRKPKIAGEPRSPWMCANWS